MQWLENSPSVYERAVKYVYHFLNIVVKSGSNFNYNGILKKLSQAIVLIENMFHGMGIKIIFHEAWKYFGYIVIVINKVCSFFYHKR